MKLSHFQSINLKWTPVIQVPSDLNKSDYLRMNSCIPLLLILIVGLSLKTSAQGGLLITPKRVVFEGNKQQAELSLMNTGTDTATYSVSFRNYNMTEQGKLALIEKSDSTQMLAEPFLRIFPRLITLAPGEAQDIMLQFRRKVDMMAGEYRSHLWFRDEKNYAPLGKEKPSLDQNQLSVSVTAIYGVTIPVIIRIGALSLSATLSDLKLETKEDTIQNLKLTINRTGNISINGKLKVEYISSKGKSYQVALMNVGIYTNLKKRDISIKLNKPNGQDFKTGKLKVRYTSPDDAKYVVYAEGELNL